MSRSSLEESRTPDVLSHTDSYPSTPSSSPHDSNQYVSRASSDVDFDPPPYVVATVHTAIIAPPATQSSSASKLILTMLCGSVNFLRIAAVTQTLFARWLHQLFLELERYDVAPPQKAQETWLGYPIMGCSALLAILVKTLNAVAKGGEYLAAEDYLFTLFCSSLFYFFVDLITDAQTISLGAFIATSAIALPLAGAFFLKLMSPDSDDQFYWRATDLNYITQLRYISGQPGECLLNAITSMKYGAESLTVLCWMMNREVHGKTVVLPAWQMGLVGAAMLASVKVGYNLTDNPIRFQKFIMLSKFFQDGALSYAAFSGICYMLFSEKSYFNDSVFRAMLTVICALLAVGIGVYSAATTRFRFEENVEGIEKIVGGLRAARDAAGNCASAIAGVFSSCCKKEQSSEYVEYTEGAGAASTL